MQFAPRPPYDFARTVQASRFLYVMGEARPAAYRRALRVGAAVALVEVTSLGTVDAPLLDVQLLAASAPPDETALVAKLRRVLNLDADLAPFYALAAADPVLAQTVERLYGLHHFQSDSLYEAVMLTMIEQQIALKMAQSAERWLLASAGDPITHEAETYYAFPTPERIATMTVADLTPLKITFGRMQRMIDLSRAVVTGQLDLEALRDQPVEDVYRALVALNGIGHWTAAWTLVRAQGTHAFVGASDVALRAAVNHYYFGLTGRAAPQQVDQTFARYGAFAPLAAFYTLMRWAFDRY